MKKYGRKGISYNSMNVRGQVDDIVCVCVCGQVKLHSWISYLQIWVPQRIRTRIFTLNTYSNTYLKPK